jgi:alkylation response protein AidB-like acyl-CoA dehydrogenase
MDLRDAPEQAELRRRARDWLDHNLPPGWAEGRREEPADLRERFAFRHRWHVALYRGGWLGLQWPRRYGGPGRSVLDQLVLNEELARREAPPIANWVGVELVGPTIMRFGSDEQRDRLLPRILDGSHVWCQSFSEPEAGSDLAAVSTAARPADGGFVITGRKRWTSWAQFGHFTLLLARTGDPELRHRSLSCFTVPLDAPGLRITPIRMIYGDAEENELELDGVRAGPGDLLGELNGGWRVLLYSLSLSRGMVTLTRTVGLQSWLLRLWRSARALPSPDRPALDDPSVRQAFAGLFVRVEALRYLSYRKVGETDQDTPGPIACAEKLVWSELTRDLTDLALRVQGPLAQAETDLGEGSWPGQWQYEYFRAKANAVEGGTSEIQRNTIARAILA